MDLDTVLIRSPRDMIGMCTFPLVRHGLCDPSNEPVLTNLVIADIKAHLGGTFSQTVSQRSSAHRRGQTFCVTFNLTWKMTMNPLQPCKGPARVTTKA